MQTAFFNPQLVEAILAKIVCNDGVEFGKLKTDTFQHCLTG